MKLYEQPAPLCSESDIGTVAVRILLLDGDLQPRSAWPEVPALPASFRGRVGERLELTTGAGRLVVVGCGLPGQPRGEADFWKNAGALVVDAMRALAIESAALGGALLPSGGDASMAAQQFAIGASLAAYRCTAYRQQAPKGHFPIRALGLTEVDWAASAGARELVEAINWARALVDAPANLLTPAGVAAEAGELARLGISMEVLDVPALERLGAGGLLAVGRGSEHAPCMLVCRWAGRPGEDNDLGLVGKGLTFDGGGLNLKQRPVIEKMKFDMAGAAAVVGSLRALASRRAPLNVVAAIPLAENAIDARAYRPGDVITSLSGLTIEVDNTDAEGRIVLADALSHLIQAHRPRLLVDIATLTGAIMSALHEEFAGLFTTDDELASLLGNAAESSGEALWRMPLSPRHDYLVESDIADVRNVAAPGFMGVGMGSSIGGAKFLQKFAGGSRWAHLDIAGVAWTTRPLPGIPKGPTGFGVLLLDQLARSLEGRGGAA